MTQERERRLVNEWLRVAHREHIQKTRVRVGPAIDHPEAKALVVLMRWVDALVYDGNNVILVEAKLRPDAGAIGQLEHYRDLFIQTPDYKLWWDLPVKLVLLSALRSRDIEEICAKKGIEFVLFRPAWVDELR